MQMISLNSYERVAVPFRETYFFIFFTTNETDGPASAEGTGALLRCISLTAVLVYPPNESGTIIPGNLLLLSPN
jgi:hypothetical protein